MGGTTDPKREKEITTYPVLDASGNNLVDFRATSLGSDKRGIPRIMLEVNVNGRGAAERSWSCRLVAM